MLTLIVVLDKNNSFVLMLACLHYFMLLFFRKISRVVREFDPLISPMRSDEILLRVVFKIHVRYLLLIIIVGTF